MKGNFPTGGNFWALK